MNIIPILQIRKLKLKEAGQLAPKYTANKWHSQDLNACLSM